MKKTNIIFWVVTTLFLAFTLFSATTEIMNGPDARKIIDHLRFPDYINPFIGVMKIFGLIAILVPGFPRIKEWAYAGFFFDLIAATYAQIATDGFMPQIAFMLVFFAFLFISYIYYHKRVNNSRSGVL